MYYAKILKPLTCFIFSLALISVISPAIKSAYALEMEFKSRAALLMEYNSGKVIYSLNENERIFPASITKIMTLLLALESLHRGDISLQDEVPITQNAASMGGAQLFLSQGDVVDMESLLTGIAVGSANDATLAVAEYIAGSEKAFVEMMNMRAAELKMKNTNFVNPTGLHHAEHFSSAFDIALMSRELLKHDLFFRWSTIWMDENFLEGRIKSGKVYLSNTNRMIRTYRNSDGIKTGYTRESGHSIAASAMRNGTRFIAIVLGAPDKEIRYQEATALLNYAFANFTSISLKNEKEKVARLPVEKGNLAEVDIVTTEKVSFLLKKGEDADYNTKVELPSFLRAPLHAGEKVGEILVTRGDEVLKAVDLVAAQDVEKATFSQLLRRYFNFWVTFGRK